MQAARQALAAARQIACRSSEAQLGATKSRLTEVRKNAPRQVETRRASVLSGRRTSIWPRRSSRQAELNLGYATGPAPVAGVVGKKAVSVGDRVAPGQQLLAIAADRTSCG